MQTLTREFYRCFLEFTETEDTRKVDQKLISNPLARMLLKLEMESRKHTLYFKMTQTVRVHLHRTHFRSFGVNKQ